MTDDAPETTRRAPRLFWFILVLAVIVVLGDQASKWWAESALGDGERIPVIGELLHFVLVYNTGAAFSLGAGYTWVLALLAGVAALAIGWYSWRVRSWPWALAAGLVLGGAITHFGDRVFRGKVVDFIGYGDLFVGNIADIAIVGGAMFAVLLVVLKVPLTGRTASADVGGPA